ncbi:MAG: precorrin-4 C(11)-methyltransferase [Candidatus Magnetobacterium sp. LHC-1]|uniref:Precorrin-4 C(11)-methyltransferase n=1 Tax=Candidatus Magnetobacterium casense TaxID=1455061 RepID=A0ABS6RZV6_9BACT|nr:precorrin-4 C(11)-methyltransferase [Candidatus Magnetobacterium casensis]MBF0606235.1 precorrin-4 C(11)-methyltransferase [Nitrospirota bacterium]MBV6342154.1 precorrin-4 C(11)-methyltransferase [Candidatus Magnetobacterium casensis]
MIYFVGAGPGNPELITLKGHRLLKECDVVIYAGSLVNPVLVTGLKAKVYDSAHMPLEEITDTMVTAAREGKMVVRLHSGDTSFYSAITEQIHRLKTAGIAYEVVPGVSSLGAAAAAIGQELTIPEVSQSVIVTRIEGNTAVPSGERLSALATHKATMVIFLSIAHIEAVVSELATSYPADTPVVVVERASWPQQRVFEGTIRTIAAIVKEAGITKTALILVGEALKTDTTKRSRLYDGEFQKRQR